MPSEFLVIPLKSPPALPAMCAACTAPASTSYRLGTPRSSPSALRDVEVPLCTACAGRDVRKRTAWTVGALISGAALTLGVAVLLEVVLPPALVRTLALPVALLLLASGIVTIVALLRGRMHLYQRALAPVSVAASSQDAATLLLRNPTFAAAARALRDGAPGAENRFVATPRPPLFAPIAMIALGVAFVVIAVAETLRYADFAAHGGTLSDKATLIFIYELFGVPGIAIVHGAVALLVVGLGVAGLSANLRARKAHALATLARSLLG